LQKNIFASLLKLVFRNALKLLLSAGYQPVVKRYLTRERSFSYKGITIKVLPGVFHPGLFFSTKILLAYLEKSDLKNKKFLEPGAGTGLISLAAARAGALVTATDFSGIAIQNILLNQQLNNLSFPVIHSDLFDNVPESQYDIVVINPPYYRGEPKSESDYAWYCGKNFEYFVKLFSQLSSFIHERSKVWMILSEDCETAAIMKIAAENNFTLAIVYEQKNWLEKNFIFSISKS